MWAIFLKEHGTIYNTIFTTITTTIRQDIPNKYLHYFTTDHIYYLPMDKRYTSGDLVVLVFWN